MMCPWLTVRHLWWHYQSQSFEGIHRCTVQSNSTKLTNSSIDLWFHIHRCRMLSIGVSVHAIRKQFFFSKRSHDSATSTDYFKIITLYEVSHERVWLRIMMDHILKSCGIEALNTPTIIFENNTAYVLIWNQVILGAILPKILPPKLLYIHELQKISHMIISLIYSQRLCHIPHFINVLKILVGRGIGTCNNQGEHPFNIWHISKHHIVIFSLCEFYFVGFSNKVFNKVIST